MKATFSCLAEFESKWMHNRKWKEIIFKNILNWILGQVCKLTICKQASCTGGWIQTSFLARTAGQHVSYLNPTIYKLLFECTQFFLFSFEYNMLYVKI